MFSFSNLESFHSLNKNVHVRGPSAFPSEWQIQTEGSSPRGATISVAEMAHLSFMMHRVNVQTSQKFFPEHSSVGMAVRIIHRVRVCLRTPDVSGSQAEGIFLFPSNGYLL